MTMLERSEMLQEIRARVESISEVSKRNGAIKCGEDVRRVYREMGAELSSEEEKRIRCFAVVAN